MLVGAGTDPATQKMLEFHLTDAQADALGLSERADPLGCGLMACAYRVTDDAVVKITRDPRDAAMSYVVMNNPQPWAIPIGGVWSLHDGHFAIAAPYVRTIQSAAPDIARELHAMYDETVRRDMPYSGWKKYREAKTRSFDEDLERGVDPGWVEDKAHALALASEAVEGFAGLGMEWLDYHGGNWGIYDGRPVVLDLGLSQPFVSPPVRALERARRLPRL